MPGSSKSWKEKVAFYLSVLQNWSVEGHWWHMIRGLRKEKTSHALLILNDLVIVTIKGSSGIKAGAMIMHITLIGREM